MKEVFSKEVQQKIRELLADPVWGELKLVFAHNDLNLTNFLKDDQQ